ncbi:MAG TPA: ACP S-malonyltransferase [Steroidobacteraceae bacterium]|nr:ACP S-malonyltransferase [Steroidobacteraceae bacterium]
MSLAVVFPGQGSQSVGMLGALAAAEPVVGATFAEASAVLGYDLGRLVAEGPEELLNSTERTQPAMLAAGVAVWRAFRARGAPDPALLAGHSLGEFTALVCAEALEFRDAVAVVQFRGRVMQEAMPAGQGAMAAILGLEDADVEAACAEAAQGEVVEPVNYNSPGQLVIAGHAAAVARALEAAKARGAKRALLLPVSVPAHSSLLRAAGERLRERLATVPIAVPRWPVYALGLGRHDSAAAIRDQVVAQLSCPVRWTDTIRDMVARGATRIVECGPGKVLTALNRRIERNKDIAMQAIEDPVSLAAALA